MHSLRTLQALPLLCGHQCTFYMYLSIPLLSHSESKWASKYRLSEAVYFPGMCATIEHFWRSVKIPMTLDIQSSGMKMQAALNSVWLFVANRIEINVTSIALKNDMIFKM